ncbi:MAG: hypothetical protein U0930_11560 [Pirellulales bacterium]
MTTARENPFASRRVESLRYRFPGFDFSKEVKRLEAMCWRAEILGPHGSGKTTLLLELFEYLKTRDTDRKCRFWFVPREIDSQAEQWQTLCQECTADEIVMIDGIERLSWMRRAQIVRRLPTRIAGGNRFPRSVVITTHRPMGLPLWLKTDTSRELLLELLLELNPLADQNMQRTAEQIFARSNGNVREVFWQLYDRIS